MKGFTCSFCQKFVPLTKKMAVRNRNHCPFCLWSKHLDSKTAGDRKSECLGGMEPIGLTSKKSGLDKWGKTKEGEWMLIHRCQKCGKISLNRLAADDSLVKLQALSVSQAVHL